SSPEGDEDISEKIRVRISFANLALWMAHPCCIGFQVIGHASRETENDAWIPKHVVSNLSLLKPHQQDWEGSLSEQDIQVAQELTKALTQLARDSNPVWIAARLLWQALTESTWEVRYVLLWVALEALFGPSDPHETTYRLSQQIAFFLANNKEEAK